MDFFVGTSATLELQIIGAAVTLGIIQLLLGSVAARTQQGYHWGMGPRDEHNPISGVPARLQRAFTNYMETFPMFVAAMLAAVMLGKTGTLTEVGGYLYLAGRVAFIPLYAGGVRNLRTYAWVVAGSGLCAVVAAIFV
ncbi:MAG: putative MAPEG superfamily protein [Candidatus Azotimanducaceae bacterium]|jgi:uncharacterized MAPEG superfamily protein